jgi:hypothetical protein
MILSTGTSAILLNCAPRKKFYCRNGVMQGDPLSPVIFVLDANLLQSILNKAMNQKLIVRPIPCHACPYFPIV